MLALTPLDLNFICISFWKDGMCECRQVSVASRNGPSFGRSLADPRRYLRLSSARPSAGQQDSDGRNLRMLHSVSHPNCIAALPGLRQDSGTFETSLSLFARCGSTRAQSTCNVLGSQNTRLEEASVGKPRLAPLGGCILQQAHALEMAIKSSFVQTPGVLMNPLLTVFTLHGTTGGRVQPLQRRKALRHTFVFHESPLFGTVLTVGALSADLHSSGTVSEE